MNQEMNGYPRTFYQNLHLSSEHGWLIIANSECDHLPDNVLNPSCVTTPLITAFKDKYCYHHPHFVQRGSCDTEAELLSIDGCVGCIVWSHVADGWTVTILKSGFLFYISLYLFWILKIIFVPGTSTHSLVYRLYMLVYSRTQMSLRDFLICPAFQGLAGWRLVRFGFTLGILYCLGTYGGFCSFFCLVWPWMVRLYLLSLHCPHSWDS